MALFILDTFKIQEGNIYLSDCIRLPKGEYETLTVQQIQSLKQIRFDEYKYLIEHPPISQEPTREELEIELVQVNQVIVELDSQKKDLEKKIKDKKDK